MKRFEAIIQSEAAPSTSSLWLKNRKIWYFDGGWKPVEGAFDIPENLAAERIAKLLIGDRHFIGPDKINVEEELELLYNSIDSQAVASVKAQPYKKGMLELWHDQIQRDMNFPLVWDKINFKFGPNTSISDNADMLDYIEGHLGGSNVMSTYVPVYITNLYDKHIDHCPAIYYNAYIYTILDGKLKVYNVDTNEGTKGTITELKTVDLTLLPTYIDLELGNSPAVKSYNLEQLQKVSGTQFFVHADYGIGVGTFNSGYGGETTIQTAGGDRVHYLITSEGECKKQEGRFEHSELFFNLGEVDVDTLPKTVTISNSIEMNKFKKATSLAFEASKSGALIDDVSMNQVSVNTLTNQRIYTSPDLICVADQDWNYIKATATTYNDRIEIYLETV